MGTDNYPRWTVIDLAVWKLVPEGLGGGRGYIQQFKDGWVKYNRQNIKHSADVHRIPPELLGGTAWIEVGGDPQFIDQVAYNVRSFDWSGPDSMDRRMTVTKHPYQTSFGAVSIQLRTAAAAMHIDLEKMSGAQRAALIHKLETDVSNLDIVAKHLHDLILHDFPGTNTASLTQEQIRIAGARYNRGAGLDLDSIRRNTSYGDFILKIWPRVTSLLQAGASGAW